MVVYRVPSRLSLMTRKYAILTDLENSYFYADLRYILYYLKRLSGAPRYFSLGVQKSTQKKAHPAILPAFLMPDTALLTRAISRDYGHPCPDSLMLAILPTWLGACCDARLRLKGCKKYKCKPTYIIDTSKLN